MLCSNQVNDKDGAGMRCCDNVDDIVEGNHGKEKEKLYQILLLTFHFLHKERWNYLIIGRNRTFALCNETKQLPVTEESYNF